MKQMKKYFDVKYDSLGQAIIIRTPKFYKNNISKSLEIIKSDLINQTSKLRKEVKIIKNNNLDNNTKKDKLKELEEKLDEYRIAYELTADLHLQIKELR